MLCCISDPEHEVNWEHAHKHDFVGASIDGFLPEEEVFTRLQAGTSSSASSSSSKSDSDVGSFIAFKTLKSPTLIDAADASQSSLTNACDQSSTVGHASSVQV